MSKIVAALATFSVFVLPLQGHASQSQPPSNASAPQEAASTAAGSGASPVPPTATTKTPVNLQPITVTVPKPYIWTFQKGNSKVLVLGTVYPEPEGLTFIPVSINRAIAQSGAVIGPPWFHFGANVGLFTVLSV